MNKKIIALIFGLVGIVVGVLGYGGLQTTTCDLPQLPSQTKVTVNEVIDGDTFKTEKGNSVRVLNIDAPERGERCYLESKNRLEELILNKEVVLKNTDIDKYCRYLGEVYLNNKNIGLKLVEEGLALAQDQSLVGAEENAKEKEIGCKWQETEEEGNINFERLTSSSTGLEVIKACNAESQVGKEALVEGTVVDVHRSDTNTVFLNFEKVYPNQCFTAVIFEDDQFRFSSSFEERYYREEVRVKGVIEEYEGRPEIILKTPNQIEIKN